MGNVNADWSDAKKFQIRKKKKKEKKKEIPTWHPDKKATSCK